MTPDLEISLAVDGSGSFMGDRGASRAFVAQQVALTVDDAVDKAAAFRVIVFGGSAGNARTVVELVTAPAAPSDRLPSPTQRVTSRIIGPCLAAASLSLVSGVAVKSVAVGAVVPLPKGVSQLSSALMFAGLALGELAGAAALAARQHKPGARASTAARDQYRRVVIVHEFAHTRLRVAESRADAAAQALAVHQERKAGRAGLALASGWTRAVRHSRNGDSILDRVEISRVSITGP